MNFNMDVGLVVISVAYARDISDGYVCIAYCEAGFKYMLGFYIYTNDSLLLIYSWLWLDYDIFNVYNFYTIAFNLNNVNFLY